MLEANIFKGLIDEWIELVFAFFFKKKEFKIYIYIYVLNK